MLYSAKTKFDVVIVGGGMAGASLALLLADAIAKGLKVALVDEYPAQPNQLNQPSFDARTTALSLGTQKILDHLGLWRKLSNHACAIKHIQVSQQGQFGRVRLHAHEQQHEAMGYVIENRHLGQALWQGLLALDNLTILAPAKVTRYQMSTSQQGVELSIQDSQTEQSHLVEANLLVLADGASSLGCQQLGITQQRLDYQQSAVVTNVSFDQSHDNWAYERFTEQGPLALLPLTQNRFGLVWCQSPEQAQYYQSCDESQFQHKLQSLLGYKLGRINRVGERLSYPLSQTQAQEQIRKHVVVMGNAAHTLHPVAGQGFNLALRDVACLAKRIDQHWPTTECGDLAFLHGYAQARSQDQQLTIGLSHLLPSSFMQTGLSVSLLRGLAMTAFDVSPIAKKLFTKQTMGLVAKPEKWQPTNSASASVAASHRY